MKIQIPVPAGLKARIAAAAALDERSVAAFGRVALTAACQRAEADARRRDRHETAAQEFAKRVCHGSLPSLEEALSDRLPDVTQP